MITIRRSAERGAADLGWLDTRHTFSFAEYQDPRHMGFRSLRVLNEDRVRPGMGFGTHPHNDMEIVSYVLEGALQHKDSMGNGSVIVPGDVQYMSAGTGVRHSEFNPSQMDSVHFIQIWILPDRRGYAPRYAQRTFPREEKLGRLRLVASGNGAEGSIELRQDVSLYACVLAAGQTIPLKMPVTRHLWVQVARGEVDVNGRALVAGDGLSASEETAFTFTGTAAESEILVFDLA